MPSRQRVNWAKYRVFVVALVSLAILGTLLYLLTGGTLFQHQERLYVYVPDATGLAQGSPVRVDGIPVGTVSDVSLTNSKNPNRTVKVTLAIQQGRLLSIPADSYAEISTESVIGDKYVDITSGRERTSIPPGGTVPVKEGGLMKSLDLTQFEQQLRQVDAMLTNIEQGKGRVGEFVQSEDVYKTLVKRVGQIAQDLRDATSPDTLLGKAVYSEQFYRNIRDPLVQLDQTLARIQSGQGGVGRFVTDSAQYAQLDSSVQSLTRTASDLRKSPFLASDEAYRSWNQSLGSLIRSIDSFSAGPMLTGTDTYERLTGSLQEMAGTISDFRRNPKKYMRMKVF
jgi:phospholipid/cholesterol/gamma-HCH transport system substrate-binding protein